MNPNAQRLLWTGPLVGVFALVTASLADSPTGLPKSLIAYERPAFPLEFGGTSVHEGFATVAFLIGVDGSVEDAVVLEASHAAFGATVLDVLPTWHFEASTALSRREVIRFEFKQDGVVSALSHREAAKSAFASSEARLPIRTVTSAQLPNPPKRLTSPPNANGIGPNVIESGNVILSYVIDTTGKVRVPVVVSASRPELGPAAIALVKDWRFSPSMHEGSVVLVEDRRTLTFGKKE